MPGYPCCCRRKDTCGGLCPGGAPDQWQLTIPGGVFVPNGISGSECNTGECNARTGVALCDKVPTADAAAQWAASSLIGSFPTGGCVYYDDPFTACGSYTDPGSGPVPIEFLVRWQIQFNPSGQVHAVLCPVNGDGIPNSLDNYVWSKFLFGWSCGDPLNDIAYDFFSSPWGLGCDVDTGAVLSMELPP